MTLLSSSAATLTAVLTLATFIASNITNDNSINTTTLLGTMLGTMLGNIITPRSVLASSCLIRCTIQLYNKRIDQPSAVEEGGVDRVRLVGDDAGNEPVLARMLARMLGRPRCVAGVVILIKSI